MRHLLAANANTNQLLGWLQHTALSAASVAGSADCVRLLLAANANPNHAHSDHVTALIWAAEEGRTECVRLLLEANASVDQALVPRARRLERDQIHVAPRVAALRVPAQQLLDQRRADPAPAPFLS